jgi:hypothetical protein
MSRQTCSLVLACLFLVHAPVWAQSQTSQPPPPQSGSTGKRALWTLVGAGAGFAAGMFFGLSKFDDSIDSDRKVWTSAIVGAVGGGVTGALLSKNVGRARSSRGSVSRPQRPDTLDISWESALHGRQVSQAYRPSSRSR